MASQEREIDQLYQLPPSEFTSARNALAKRAGPGAARIRALVKPPLAAWAVNQLYWRRRPVWDALVTAADEARRAHKAVLSGRNADIRSSGKAHEDAVETALKAALEILKEGGHPATDATRQAIATTLRALPADEPPGRLSRTLQPGGFEALSGLSVAAGARKLVLVPKPAPKAAETAREKRKEEAERRRAEAEARREEAEHEARTKAAERELRAAERVKDRARQALERAQADFDEAGAAVEVARTRLQKITAE